MSNFDFDYWSNLANTDVESFNMQRDFIIKKAIRKISKGDSRREWVISGIQVRLNKKLSRYKDPVAKMSVVYGMMLSSLDDLNDAYKGVMS